VLRGILQFFDDLLARFDRFVLFGEVVVDVDTKLALGQIADVPHRRDHFVVAAQIFIDGLRLRRRFDHYECFCHSSFFTLTRNVKPSRIGRRQSGRSIPATRAPAAAAAGAWARARFARQSRPNRSARQASGTQEPGPAGPEPRLQALEAPAGRGSASPAPPGY